MTNETTIPPPTILIVDDDPLFREYLRELLGQEGYAIVEAVDGREGPAALIRSRLRPVDSAGLQGAVREDPDPPR